MREDNEIVSHPGADRCSELANRCLSWPRKGRAPLWNDHFGEMRATFRTKRHRSDLHISSI
jgi:hypothetical protein